MIEDLEDWLHQRVKPTNPEEEGYLSIHLYIATTIWNKTSLLHRFFFSHVVLWWGKAFQNNWKISHSSEKAKYLLKTMENLMLMIWWTIQEDTQPIETPWDYPSGWTNKNGDWKKLWVKLPWIYFTPNYSQMNILQQLSYKEEFLQNHGEELLRCCLHYTDYIDSQRTFQKLQRKIGIYSEERLWHISTKELLKNIEGVNYQDLPDIIWEGQMVDEEVLTKLTKVIESRKNKR